MRRKVVQKQIHAADDLEVAAELLEEEVEAVLSRVDAGHAHLERKGRGYVLLLLLGEDVEEVARPNEVVDVQQELLVEPYLYRPRLHRP